MARIRMILSPKHTLAMKRLLLTCILTAGLFQGCSTYRDTVRNTGTALGAIQTRDLHQASYLREWFSQVPEIKGRHSVEPGSGVVTVKFLDDLPAGKSEVFKERMIQLKQQMRQQFNYEINTLIFIFPSMEFKL